MVVLGVVGEIVGASGMITNFALDVYEGYKNDDDSKCYSAIERAGIFAATFGTGKAIEKLESLGKISNLDSKILNANKIVNDKVMSTVKEKSKKNK